MSAKGFPRAGVVPRTVSNAGAGTPAQGTMATDFSSLTFSCTVGGSSPSPRVVTVSNTGNGTLSGIQTSIVYTDGSGWLAAVVTATATGGYVTVTVDSSALVANSYAAKVRLTDANASNSPLDIDVTVAVAAVPATSIISLSGNPVSSSVTEGSTAVETGYIVVGTDGGDPLTDLAVGATSAAWCTATLNGSTITVESDPTGKTPAVYSATFNVTASNASNSPRVATVYMGVSTATYVINAAPSVKSFAAQEGTSSPTPGLVSLADGGTGNVTGMSTSIAYISGAGWLAATLSATSCPATLTITPTLGALAAGTYEATVTVDGDNSATVDIGVTFLVTAGTPPTAYPAPTYTLPSFCTFDAFTGRTTVADPFTRKTAGYFTGTVHSVATKAQWATALSTAADTDIIEITATIDCGTTAYTLPDFGAGAVLIRPSNHAALPTGRAVTPADHASTPKLITQCPNTFLTVADAATGWYLDGVVIEATGTGERYAFLAMGDYANFQSAADRPTNCCLTRCYFFADWYAGTLLNMRNGISLSGDGAIVEHCCLLGIQKDRSQTYAVAGSSGRGNFLIQENIIEASSAMMLLGGGATRCGNETYNADVAFVRNFCFRRSAWMTDAALQNDFINFVEVKNGVRWLVEGNIFTNYRDSAQSHAFHAKGVPMNATEQAWVQCWDITVRCNRWELNSDNTCGFVSYSASTSNYIPLRSGNVEVTDNYVTGLGSTVSNTPVEIGVGTEAPTGEILQNFRFERNTYDGIHAAMVMSAKGTTAAQKQVNATGNLPGLVFRDNVKTASTTTYGPVLGDGTGIGDNKTGLDQCAGVGNYICTNNVIVDTATPLSWSGLAASNLVLTSALAIASDGTITDTRLATASSTGGVPGCNITLLTSVTSGVEPTGTTGLPSY